MRSEMQLPPALWTTRIRRVLRKDFSRHRCFLHTKIFIAAEAFSRTLLTYASGGVFSKYSHEFQTVTPYGEDMIYRIPEMNTAINKEIVRDESALTELMPGYKVGDEAMLEELKAIEVGNIFKLGSRFTDAFSAQYTDKRSKKSSWAAMASGLAA